MKHVLLLLLLSLNAVAGTLPAPLIPNPSMTMGDACSKGDRDFKEYRYREHIPYCQRNVSSSLKREIYAAYGIPTNCQKDYTIDHFYPLSLGGNNQRDNLWPEHRAVKHTRQDLEMELYEQLKAGKITQSRALAEIKEAKLHPDTSKIPTGNYCNVAAKQ